MDSAIGTKLQTFNAWGMVTVSENTITVILSAMNNNQPLRRTLKAESRHALPSGSALIAVSVETDGFRLQANELDEQIVASHPDVEKVIKQAADWIKQSV